jgi:hypothetical protein
VDQKGRFSISPLALYQRLGSALSPIILDVRPAPTFDGDLAMIVGAVRREPDPVDQWRDELPRGRAIVLAASHGLSTIFTGDHEVLSRAMTVYDALYAWCRQQSGTSSNPS